MLGILLKFFEIVGIIVVVLFGLLLGLLLIVLLTPVRYRFAGEFSEQKWCKAKVTWLFRIISVPVEIDESGVRVKFKIFEIELGKSKKKEKKKKTKKVKVSKTQIVETNDSFDNAEPDIKPVKVQEIKSKEVVSKADVVAGNEQKGKKSKFTSIFFSWKEKIQNIWKKVQNLYSKAEELGGKKEKVLDFFCEEEAFQAKNQVIEILKKICKHILPYRINGNVHFGMESPEKTGQTYAILCLFYDKYANTLDLEPDFEQKIFEGKLEFWGRIRLINLVYYGIRMYRIKKLREFISLVRSLL